MKRVLIYLIILEVLFNLLLRYFSFIGDQSLEFKLEILKYFTEDDIKIGEQYAHRGLIARIVSDITQPLFLSIFVLSGFANKLESKIEIITKNNIWKTSVIFFLIIFIIQFLISLPFSFYFGFILEHKFGFSNMSFNDWVLFKSKSFVLSLIMIIFLGTFIVFILKIFPKTWKFLVPVSIFCFGLIFSILIPIFITPIFYNYEPIEEGSLKTKIIELSKKANVSIDNIYIIKESQYSKHTNAYFTGWGNNKKIFLYDTLIKNHTQEEIISVLGHELGHWIYSHQLIDLLISSVEYLFLCFLLNYFFNIARKEQIIIKEIFNPSSLIFLYLVLHLINNFTYPLWNLFSRLQETKADIVALELTNDKISFINTEIKMARDNKSRLNPHPIVEFLNFSHPKTIDRIKLAEKY